jgi:hypothetical protein
VLEQLESSEAELVKLAPDPARLRSLLNGWRELASLQHQIDALEDEVGTTVGWPRLVVELDLGEVVFVSTRAQIDQLAGQGQVSAVDARHLQEELAGRLRRWRREARTRCLPAFRSREKQLHRKLSKQTDDLLGPGRPPALGSAWVRLVLLLARMEPGEPTTHLLDIARDLRRLL